MSVVNYVPEIWSEDLLRTLKKNLIALNLTNQNYQGDVNNQGDTVHITTPGAITVSDYDGSDISFQELNSTQQDLVIDQAKSFGFDVDDVDQAQSMTNVDLGNVYMVEAAYALQKAMDTFIFESYAEADADNVIDSGGFDKTNAYEQLTLAGQLLSEKNVPEEGRYVVVDPSGINALSNNDAFLKASTLGDETAQRGFMGKAAGFDVWMSNNLVSTGSAPVVKHFVFGHPIAITFARQLNKMEAVRREKGFGDRVKGLHLYGKKVIRPTALGEIQV